MGIVTTHPSITLTCDRCGDSQTWDSDDHDLVRAQAWAEGWQGWESPIPFGGKGDPSRLGRMMLCSPCIVLVVHAIDKVAPYPGPAAAEFFGRPEYVPGAGGYFAQRAPGTEVGG